jgi:hypothetical protein
MINQEKLDSWSFCKLSDFKLEEIKNNIWNKIDFLLKTYWEKFKNYILVDDVIDPVFEKLWYWVAVLKNRSERWWTEPAGLNCGFTPLKRINRTIKSCCESSKTHFHLKPENRYGFNLTSTTPACR